MLKETFYIDGVDMRTLGVYLQRPIRISGLVPIVEKVHVEGRNGDLIFPTGAYENREGRADCFALSPTGDAGAVITAVNALLMKSQGYVELKQSEDPTHFWKARITNGADIEQRLRTLNPFTIKFDIEPEHWRIDGLETVTFTQPWKQIVNFASGTAKPIIKVHSKGNGRVGITQQGSNYTSAFSFSNVASPLVVDGKTMNFYSTAKNENVNVKREGNEEIKLLRGNTAIFWSGSVTKVEMIPRWWDL